MKKLIVVVICFLLSVNLSAQLITPEQYIEQYKDLAIREMKRMGVPAAITLAQGLLETESGNSDLVKKSNNHFGIKCKATWTANGVTHDDDAKGECFRQYSTAEESYRDHSNFLRAGDRYSFLFKLDASDYKGWAYGLKHAGYATNPAYPQILIKNIEQYNLNQYTLSAIGEVPKYDNGKYKDDVEEPAKTQGLSEQDKAADDLMKKLGNEIDTTSNSKIIIDGKKTVYGKKGTSLLKIADEQNIRLVKLLEYNDLKEDIGILPEDRIIYLEQKPADAPTIIKTAQKSPLPSIKKHVVQPKEGLYSISKKYGITMQQIRDWNNLQTDNLSIGQELIVSK
ncbi:MAG: glucosaminidase domain-containing protein [Ferruginibacter sp.]